jgi:hypothetical protein
MALDVRELTRERVFERPEGSMFHLALRYPWMRTMRLDGFSLALHLVTGRVVPCHGTSPMKPGLDRPPRYPSPVPVGPRPPSMTGAAVRARRYRQRRKNGVRCLAVEISRMEIQALVKAVQKQQADAEVNRAIRALLNASYVTGRRGRADNRRSIRNHRGRCPRPNHKRAPAPA